MKVKGENYLFNNLDEPLATWYQFATDQYRCRSNLSYNLFSVKSSNILFDHRYSLYTGIGKEGTGNSVLPLLWCKCLFIRPQLQENLLILQNLSAGEVLDYLERR